MIKEMAKETIKFKAKESKREATHATITMITEEGIREGKATVKVVMVDIETTEMIEMLQEKKESHETNKGAERDNTERSSSLNIGKGKMVVNLTIIESSKHRTKMTIMMVKRRRMSQLLLTPMMITAKMMTIKVSKVLAEEEDEVEDKDVNAITRLIVSLSVNLQRRTVERRELAKT